MRRDIVAYGFALVSGILSAYCICEKKELILGSMLFISIGIAFGRVRGMPFLQLNKNYRLHLIGFLVIGFMLLSCSYIQYNKTIRYGKDIISDINTIKSFEGPVWSMDKRVDKYIIIVKPENINCGLIRISLDHNLVENDTELDSGFALLGKKVVVNGELEIPETNDNPGSFNYNLYLKSKGIRFTCKAFNIYCNEDENSAGVIYALRKVYWDYRRQILTVRELFLSQFEQDTSSFLRGVVFGDKSEINEDIAKDFEINSTGHILAVSGLHIGFILGLLKFLSKGREGKFITALIIIIMLMYGEMTRWNPSTIRAVMVMIFKLASMHLRRPFDLLSAVTGSAMINLIWNPYQLFNSGFQLSYAALLAISVMAKPLSVITDNKTGSILAVQSGIAPLIANIYYRFNIITILVNIPVVFLASILVPLSIIGLIIQLITGTTPGAATWIISLVTELIIDINGVFADYLDCSVNTIPLNTGILIVIYCFVLGVFSEMTRVMILRKEAYKYFKLLKYVLVPVVCLSLIFHNNFRDDTISFISVGQGDSCLVSSGSSCALIDGGGLSNSNIGEKTLRPYLLNNGYRKADYAVVTHLHSDHYKGILELSDTSMVGHLCVPADYMGSNLNINYDEETSSETHGISEARKRALDEAAYIKPGDEIKLAEDITIEPIWPASGRNIRVSSDDANEHNMVYLVRAKGIKILVTGDLLEEDELKLVEFYRGTDKLDCDILKVPHHGSKTSSSREFLEAVSPEYAVISVGRNNMYGHPDGGVLKRYEEMGIKTYRTDMQGAVGFKIRRGRILRVDTVK